MFTGIIEEIGIIKKIIPISGGKQITITASNILADIEIDHSISVSGVCLTVIEIDNNFFTVEAVGETLDKTTIGKLKINTAVNLERALRLSDRIGGHLIQGHVNGIGKIKDIKKRGNNWYLEINIPHELTTYLITEGSIALDGISLTIAQLENTSVGTSIIPHTYKNTTISHYIKNQEVNIEVDYIARYVENILNKGNYNKKNETIFTKDWFKSLGY